VYAFCSYTIFVSMQLLRLITYFDLGYILVVVTAALRFHSWSVRE